MNTTDVPVIAPKPFGDHTPDEWLSYVKSLKQEPEKKSDGLSFKFTKTGKPSLTVKRDPKCVTLIELEKLSREHNVPINTLYNYVKGKKDVTILQSSKEKI